jgi:hypothetical protein
MSVHKYNIARNKALKTMAMGLVFLIFLPLGIPMSLIIIPFLAGRNGARDLPNNWHLTYILTVGGGWSIGLVVTFLALLSIALGPALRINIAEIVIFASIILFTWASFTIGVTSSKINTANNKDRPYEKEWNEEETTEDVTEDEDLRGMALTSEEKNVPSFQKMKEFLGSSNDEKQSLPKGNKNTKNTKKKAEKGKASRVSALANRRRK